MFDITLLPLLIQEGRERSNLPGLYAAAAPRKAERMRAQDVLILYLSLNNTTQGTGVQYSAAQQQEILTKLTDSYFTTAGSVTAGLRAVVTRLNDFLLNRNLRLPGEGQVTGVLNLAALHGSNLIIAHAGAAYSMLIGKTQVQQYDDRGGGRGLGLSKQLIPRFYQVTLEAGDVLLVSAVPPETWTAKSLAGATQLGLDHLRRRLIGQAGMDVVAAALKFQVGKGQIIHYRGGAERAPVADANERSARPPVKKPVEDAPQAKPNNPAAQPVPKPSTTSSVVQVPPQDPAAIYDMMQKEAEAVEETALEEKKFASQEPAEQLTEPDEVDQTDDGPAQDILAEPNLGEQTQQASPPVDDKKAGKPFLQTTVPEREQVHPPADPADGVRRGPTHTAQPVRPPTTASESPPRRPAAAQPAARPRPQEKARVRRAAGGGAFTQRFGLALKGLFQRGAAARSKIASTVVPVASRVLPHRTEPWINLSPASMLFVAICIPLVVVAIATTVYFNAGRAEQFAAYLSNASQYVERASQQTDSNLQRDSWTQALLWLDRADLYEVNETSTNLRLQAQNGLDGMEGIIRLPYQRAVTEGFGAGVSITRMAATLNDVYLLDSSQGRVLRLYRVGSSYMVDSTFLCGPGQAGGQIIGPLVDLAVLPPNNTYRATILASDVSGNVVYCAPNQTGFDSLLLPAPETNWGNIEAINISDGYIYVLDPLVNAVWYSFGNSGVFTQEPRLFFSNQVPQMDDVVDMAIDNGFLYLLHADGRMTTCEASGFELSPTRCNDPAPYGDARINRESAPLNFPDARFVQMQTTQPPDPSLFILDDARAAIYHFSLRRLNLQRQYRAMYNPDFPLPSEPPTAFVITPNRRALLAFGNQVFYAPLP